MIPLMLYVAEVMLRKPRASGDDPYGRTTRDSAPQ